MGRERESLGEPGGEIGCEVVESASVSVPVIVILSRLLVSGLQHEGLLVG